MKQLSILILYATRGGATKRAVEMLEQILKSSHKVTLVNAQEEQPVPNDFDAIVLASSIRAGKIDKTLKKYIKQHKDILSEKATAVGLCCGYPRYFEEYIETQLPRTLVCSLGYHSFGGELKPDKRKGFDKLVVRNLRSSILSQDFEESDVDHHQLPELLPENIALLADKIKQFSLEH